MYLSKIRLVNFRSAGDLEIQFDRYLNVFYGVNGAGKTTVLDASAIMLSWLANRIKRSGVSGRPFPEDDIKNGQSSTKVEITLKDKEEEYSWNITKTRKGHSNTFGRSHLLELGNLTSELRDTIALTTGGVNIPLFAYYPINRNVLDIPLRIRKKHKFELLEAYDEALTTGMNFRSFFEWFRQREDLENEQRTDNFEFRDFQLEPVRQALNICLPHFKDLRVRRNPLRMEVNKFGDPLKINQLSDGEKCLITLIGDIARRLAIANPKSQSPLNGEGVILIDEIDMHLHPKWQKNIVGNLRTTFPNCQFLLSTHSPHILTHMQPENLHTLSLEDNTLHASQPNESYGREVDRILENLMGLETTRPDKVQEQLNVIFDNIAANKLEDALRCVDDLSEKIGADPELVKARVLIKRKEVIGK
jgi:predicted ATP-binding protein involved in virulence